MAYQKVTITKTNQSILGISKFPLLIQQFEWDNIFFRNELAVGNGSS